MPDLSFGAVALLFAAGLLGGIISAVSGGAGLLIAPLCLFFGFSPIQSIATMDLYSVPSQLSAGFFFWRKGHLPKWVVKVVPIVLICGALGAISVGSLPSSLLKMVMPFILIGLALWFGLHPDLKPAAGGRKLSFRQFGFFALPFFAFYDGFFGVCSTTFYTLGYLTLLDKDLIEATAAAKIFSAVSSMAALSIFIARGDVVWSYGLIMAFGGIFGARLGAGMVIKHGAPLVRWLVVVTSIAASAKLLASHNLLGRFFNV